MRQLKILTKIKLAPLLVAVALLCGLPNTASAAEAHVPLPNLIPIGVTVGMQIDADGALIIGLNTVAGTDSSPASEAGLRGGDIILYLGSEKIDSVEECRELIAESGDHPISVRVVRNGKILQFEVKPVINADGMAELGIWLRDAIAGIGTVTFLNPANGIFGALGHSISDGDTGTLLPLKRGTVMPAEVAGIVRGETGTPGQLQGNLNPYTTLGNLTRNTDSGVFGTAASGAWANYSHIAIPAASKSELHVGKAQILSNVSGSEVKSYDVEIIRVFPGSAPRDMLITVTDAELIAATGGIVQGMSGSPIIQDGKLVGAVTHVLVSDPKKGYGISIERMLDACS